MPRVLLTFSDNTRSEASGGCFGFCGRSSLNGFSKDRQWVTRSDANSITGFKYFVGDLFNSSFTGLKDPKPYLRWLATDSPWAKYVTAVHNIEGTCERAEVEIRTDIPGHCVIGTASAFRLAGKHQASPLIYFNLALQMSSNKSIAFLVYYAMYTSSIPDFTTGPSITHRSTYGRLTTASSAQVGLGDDEVMSLSSISPSDLYSFINGSFEMIRQDSSESLFSQTASYSQDILRSYTTSPDRRSKINLSRWLQNRFPNNLTANDQYTVDTQSGMSDSDSQIGTTPGHTLLPTLGWVSTLSNEFSMHERFLGLIP